MTDTDLSEFRALSKPRRMKCTVAVVLGRLAKKDQAKLTAAIAAAANEEEDITYVAVCEWVAAKTQIKVNSRTLSRHARHQCNCDA